MLTKFSPLDGTVQHECLDENLIPWQYPPYPVGATVRVYGRAEYGDVEALDDKEGTIIGHSFSYSQGNTFTVRVLVGETPTDFSGVLPSMLDKIGGELLAEPSDVIAPE